MGTMRWGTVCNWGLIGLAMAGAWARRFVLDDAFITFRYATHWAHGLGPVFNEGERVEGYTNFLWVCLLVPFARTDVDLVVVANGLALACFAATLSLVALESRRVAALHGSTLPSIALLACATSPSLLSFSTGGLETSLFGFLALGCTVLTQRLWQSGSARTAMALGLVATALVLTRPDGALLAGVCLIAGVLGCSPGERGRLALHMALPVGVLLLPVLVAKRVFYGDWLPNTFYAKNAHEWRFDVGLSYLWAFARSAPLLSCVPVVLVVVMLAPKARQPASGAALKLPAVLVSAVILFSVYIAKVGGDFMEFRFMAPLIPLLALALEQIAATVRWRTGLTTLIAGAQLVLFATREPEVLPPPLMETVDSLASHISTERWDDVGIRLGTTLPPNTVLATSAAGAIPYYSRLRTIDVLGLTDALVARGPGQCTDSVTIGHCKAATREYLVERGVNLYVAPPHAPFPSFSTTVPQHPDELVFRLWDDAAVTLVWINRTPELQAIVASNPDFKVWRRDR